MLAPLDNMSDAFKEVRRQSYYDIFGAEFNRRMRTEFSESDFADLIKSAGARYYVVTSKHHEGFTLWPSKVKHPRGRKDLNSQVDLLGKLSTALRERGIRFGVYYSGGVDWSIKYPGTPSPKDEDYEPYAL